MTYSEFILPVAFVSPLTITCYVLLQSTLTCLATVHVFHVALAWIVDRDIPIQDLGSRCLEILEWRKTHPHFALLTFSVGRCDERFLESLVSTDNSTVALCSVSSKFSLPLFYLLYTNLTLTISTGFVHLRKYYRYSIFSPAESATSLYLHRHWSLD